MSKYQLVSVVSKSGEVWPAFQVGEVFLAHPGFTEADLTKEYVIKTLAALETKEGAAGVTASADSGYQFDLKIAEKWYAHMSVHTNASNQIVATLHFSQV